MNYNSHIVLKKEYKIKTIFILSTFIYILKYYVKLDR